MDIERLKVKEVVCLGEVDDYVYDLSIRDQDPFFFGNDILLHNTDSAIFSAYPGLKKEIESNKIAWDKDTVIKLYDAISTEVNNTFPTFMLESFHCPKSRGEVIRAGREIVGQKGLFITKKRYAILYYDKEGKRLDTDNRTGKLKAMGLDLKRADTPEYMQKFLEQVLNRVLEGAQEQEILDMIVAFRSEFKSRPGWEKGTPKRVNNLTEYANKENSQGKTNMPGHVRAAINWNTLKRMNNDRHSLQITDGMKVIVCKLKRNPLGFTSVAYPIDEMRLPKWFQELPFDHDEMESTIINNKIENLIGVLNWSIQDTQNSDTFNSLFSIE